MQITLTQADIEAAILTHLGLKLKFEEGFTPSIELKATRGDAGFTALVDLDDDKSIVKVPRQPRAKQAEKPVPTAETAQEAQQAPVAEKATTTTTEAETAEEATEEAETEAVADAPIPDKPKSLFAGLQKPKN